MRAEVALLPSDGAEHAEFAVHENVRGRRVALEAEILREARVDRLGAEVHVAPRAVESAFRADVHVAAEPLGLHVRRWHLSDLERGERIRRNEIKGDGAITQLGAGE